MRISRKKFRTFFAIFLSRPRGALRDDTDGCVADYGAQGCKVKSVIPKIKHCKLKRLEKT